VCREQVLDIHLAMPEADFPGTHRRFCACSVNLSKRIMGLMPLHFVQRKHRSACLLYAHSASMVTRRLAPMRRRDYKTSAL
jgi:hypothetical protein